MLVDVEQVEHLEHRLDARPRADLNGRDTRRSSELKLSVKRAVSDDERQQHAVDAAGGVGVVM